MLKKYSRKIKRILISFIPDHIYHQIKTARELNITIIKCRKDYLRYIAKHFEERMISEKHIADSNINNKEWLTNGFCIICDKKVQFKNNWNNHQIGPRFGKMPCYRERMVCPVCGLNNRMRFAAFYLDKILQEKNLTMQLFTFMSKSLHFSIMFETNTTQRKFTGASF